MASGLQEREGLDAMPEGLSKQLKLNVLDTAMEKVLATRLRNTEPET